MNDDISTIKRTLRAEARCVRRSFTARLAPGNWDLTVDPFVSIASDQTMVASYRPIRSETDPNQAESRCLALGARLCYPRIEPDNAMRFYAITPDTEWKTAANGIEEPIGETREVSPDIVLLPLLAFDRTGTRLGQGGGHYDRALARLAKQRSATDAGIIKIGIAWSVQELVDLPREQWDVPLDIIITEREWIEVD
jgi:5-formyltetrahydrofolate cyclo-ligase